MLRFSGVVQIVGHTRSIPHRGGGGVYHEYLAVRSRSEEAPRTGRPFDGYLLVWTSRGGAGAPVLATGDYVEIEGSIRGKNWPSGEAKRWFLDLLVSRWRRIGTAPLQLNISDHLRTVGSSQIGYDHGQA